MSRGIGKTQRAILDALSEYDSRPYHHRYCLKTREVAALVYRVPKDAVTKRQMTLVGRSLLRLAAIGLVYSLHRTGYAQWFSRKRAVQVWGADKAEIEHKEFVDWHTNHKPPYEMLNDCYTGRMVRAALKTAAPKGEPWAESAAGSLLRSRHAKLGDQAGI